MNGTGIKEGTPQIPFINDSSSDDDEAETDVILASLLTQLDNLERQQHETVTFVHDQLQAQRQAVDVLRKSVRKAESVIHQKRFSRQRAKIKRLKELKAASTPSSHNVTPVTSAIKYLGTPQEKKLVLAEKRDANGKMNGSPSGNKVSATTPTFASSMLTAALKGESSFNNHDEDTVMMGGDDEDDNRPISVSPPNSPPDSPAAPVAPPMETPETRKAAKKPTVADKVTERATTKAADKAAETEEKSRPVQKMRPTRGNRYGRGSAIARKPQGGSVIGSTSSRSNSHEIENVTAPPAPRGRGIGTAMRSRPFKRGTLARSVSSTEGNDISEVVTKAPARSGSPTGFVAVNTPHPPVGAGPSNWLDDYQTEDGLPLSSLAAGAGMPRAAGSPSKPLPPPRSRGQEETSGSGKKNSKLLQSKQDLPAAPVLFSFKDLRKIFGGGNPGSIMASTTQDGRVNAVVKYSAYICLSPDAHFDPPGTMCDNAEMLDIDGEEDPLDSDTIYPVWKKIDKMWMYCGDYTQGLRRTVPVEKWRDSNEAVRKYWAKKVQETEWGRDFLVMRGFRRHGEIKNNTVQEVMGYFDLPDGKNGLRLSATTLNFKTFNRHNYDLMVAKAESLNAAGLLLVPLSTLKPNNIPARPRVSLAADPTPPKASKIVSPARERKRRRVESVTEDENDPETPLVSERRPVLVGSERGRRASRNEVNYRIAPLSEFEGELVRVGGKGKGEVIELSEGDDGDDDQAQEDDEEEEEEDGDDDSGDEGEMVID